jgi:23S rRNA G2069 N7-methylase RlmK/C1962 C5-methylase RlmI
VDRIEGEPVPGDTVRVLASSDEPLAIGDWDPDSQIRVRIHAFGPDAPDAGEAWLEERIAAALRWRRATRRRSAGSGR